MFGPFGVTLGRGLTAVPPVEWPRRWPRDYLAGVPTDRSQMLDLVAGMTALGTMLIQMRAEETGARPEETLAELGRRVQELLSGSG